MDKKFLRNIKRPVATDEWLHMAQDNEKMRYLIDVHEEGEVLAMDFFEKSKLSEECREASFRIFADDEGYITQDLTTDKTKWMTAKMEHICSCSYWTYSSYYNPKGLPRHYDLVFTRDECRELIGERFGWPEKEGCTVWDCFMDWQDGIAKNRLFDKHHKALAHTNLMMEMVPAVPDDFEHWAYDYAMREHRYLIFDAASTKRHKDAFCTHCYGYMKVDTKKHKLKNDSFGVCPECDTNVYMKSYKRWHDTEYANKFTCLLQKVGDYVLARYFRIGLHFDKGNYEERRGFKRTMCISEECRIFYNYRMKTCESFEFKQYKTMPGSRWCPDEGVIDCTHAVVYTKNLPQELVDTPWQYSGMDAYQLNEGSNRIPVWGYMKYFPKYPELEYLAKTGLTRYLSDLVCDSYRWRYNGNHGVDIKSLRKLSKPNMKILRKLNGNSYMMRLLTEVQLCNFQMSVDEVDEFMTYLGPRTDTIRKLGLIDLHPRKLVAYIKKQYLKRHDGKDRLSIANRREECKNICHDWEDYIGWCQDLEMNLNDSYVLFPPNLTQAHDRVLAEKQAKEDAIMQKRMEEESRLIKQIMEDSKTVEPLQMHTKRLMIVLPNGVADLKTEGETLHHCVATYADKVAKGKTLILFIRQVEAPNTPFYTLEWKDHKVAQCRGYRNCGMTDEVSAFVKAFEKKMSEYERRKVS